jgi:hypothetical protein
MAEILKGFQLTIVLVEKNQYIMHTKIKKEWQVVYYEEGNNADWPYVDTQKGNNVDSLLGTFFVET